MLLMMKEALNTITLPPNYVAYDERGVKPYHLNMLLMMKEALKTITLPPTMLLMMRRSTP